MFCKNTYNKRYIQNTLEWLSLVRGRKLEEANVDKKE